MAVKGARCQAIGASHGGQTTEIHALSDVIGRPFAFRPTGGNAADSPVPPLLPNGLKGARYLLGDKGYDANALRKRLRQSAIVPVISGPSNRKRSIVRDRQRDKERHLIETAFRRPKDFRNVATRQGKRPETSRQPSPSPHSLHSGCDWDSTLVKYSKQPLIFEEYRP